jgi:Tol biopolymer transport system component
MRLHLAMTAVASACALAVAGDGPAEPLILVPTFRTGHVGLFLMKMDGSNPQTVADNDWVDSYPAWSHDAKKIAFVSNRDGPFHIYVMDADGRNARRLTNESVPDFYPTWSPDDKKIAFGRGMGQGNQEIFVMNADGSNPTNCTNNPATDACPDWSPDGKKIAFSSNRSGQGSRIYTMDPDGRNVQEITKADSVLPYMCPGWSPDGKKLLFAENTGTGAELHLCNADGTNRQQLTNLGGRNTQGVWSRDGKKIAFMHLEGGASASSLYIMDADGANPTEVLKEEGPPSGGRPAWRPHGK